MNRRLNIKLLASLGIGSLIFIILVFVVHKWQVKGNAHKLLTRAGAERDEGNYSESIRLTKRFLQHEADLEEPSSSASQEEKDYYQRYLAAFKNAALDSKNLLYERIAEDPQQVHHTEFSATSGLLEMAIRKQSKDIELRREVSDLLYTYYYTRPGDAIDHMKVFESEWTVDDKLRYINCLMRQGGTKEEDAIAELEKFLGFDLAKGEFDESKAEHPEVLAAYQSLAGLLMQNRTDRVQAENALNQMVKVNQDNYKSYLHRAQLLPQINGVAETLEQVKSDIKTAFGMNPDGVDALAAMANMLLREQQYDEAARLVDKGLLSAETSREKGQLYNLKAQLAAQSQDTEGALKIIEEGLRAVPLDGNLLWKKARLLLDAEDFAGVEGLYKRLQRARTSDGKIAYLQARIMMSNGDHANAVKKLTAIRPLLKRDPAMQYEIDVYLNRGLSRTGQHDVRYDVLHRMLKASPDTLSTKEGIAQVLSALGRNRSALNWVRKCIGEYQAKGEDIPAGLANMEAAFDMRETLIVQNTDGELDPAEETRIKRKIKAIWDDESRPEAQRRSLVVDLFRMLKKPEEAMKFVESGLKKEPDSYGLNALAIDLAQNEQDALSAFRRMEGRLNPKTYGAAMRTIRAKLALKYNSENAAEIIKQQEADIETTFGVEQQAALYFELGKLQLLGVKDRVEGTRLLEKALVKDPKRIDILKMLYEDATRGNDPDRVNLMVKRIQDVTTANDDTWRMAEAGKIIWFAKREMLAADVKDNELARARGLIEKVRSSRPDWLPVMLMDAELSVYTGKDAEAAAALQSALKLSPGNPRIIRMLSSVLRKNGQFEQATSLMESLPMAMRSAGDNRSKLGMLWQSRGSWKAADAANAIKLAEIVLPLNSKSVNDLLLRSRLFAAAATVAQIGKQPAAEITKNYRAAEEAALQAKSIDRTHPDIWVTLTSLLAVQGRKSEAEDLLKEAEVELPAASKSIIVGKCQAVLGNHQVALTHYAAALKDDPTNATVQRFVVESLMTLRNLPAAQKGLAQIIQNGDPEKHGAAVAWARYKMAELYASTNSYQAFNQGLKLLEANAVKGEMSSNDLALWVSSCFRRPERASWERALARFDMISAKRELTDSEMFMKAQILERFGDEYWDQVQRITRDVLTKSGGAPPSTSTIDSWVVWLLKRAKQNPAYLEEARRWANNNLDAKSVNRLRVEVHSMASKGQLKEALATLKGREPGKMETPAEMSAMLTVAAITEELGQYDKRFYQLAEKRLEKLVAAAPGQQMRLAALRGTRSETPDRINNAIAMCLQAEPKTIPAAQSTGTAIAILREHSELWDSSLKSAVQAVGQKIEQLASATPDDLGLRYRVAEFHDMMGNLDRVETEYRLLLDNPKFNNPLERGMVLNNLAYAMALNGKVDEPFSLLKEAESLIGPTSDLIDTTGYVHFARGEYTEAVEKFRLALRGTESAQKLFHLTLALDKQGQSEQAREAWDKAIAGGLTKYKVPRALHDEFEAMRSKFRSGPAS